MKLPDSPLEAVPVGVLVIREAAVIFVNRKVEAMTGRPRDTIVGIPVAELLAPEHRATVEGAISVGEDAMAPGGAEVQFLHPDGTRIPLRIELHPYEEGGVPHVLVCCHDAVAPATVDPTVAWVAAEHANGSGKSFFEVMAANLAGHLSADGALICRRVGTAGANVEILGFSFDGSTWPRRVFDAGPTFAGRLIAAAGYQESGRDVALSRALGIEEERIEAFAGLPVISGSDDRTGFLCVMFRERIRRPSAIRTVLEFAATRVAKNVDREQYLAALRESEQRYHRLVDSAPDVIFTLSPLGFITGLNRTFEIETGWPRSMWLGRNFRSLVYGHDAAKATEMFRRAIDEDVSGIFELKILMKDGGYVDTEFRITREVERGRLKGILGIARNITAEKKLERHLNQARKLESLGALASGIAHDFNNMLSIIIGYAKLLEPIVGPDPRGMNAVDSITRTSHRGAALVHQLLTFARETEPRLVTVDANRIIEEAGELLGETFPKMIRVVVLMEPALPPVAADATQLHQVLLNLCVNARDAMPAGGTLTIASRLVPPDAAPDPAARVRPGDVEIAVTDTGSGMDEETASRIFEPFFTTKEKGKGTGLGLATVYGIVQKHGGTITVESHPGAGTTFRVFLPPAEEKPAPPPA